VFKNALTDQAAFEFVGRDPVRAIFDQVGRQGTANGVRPTPVPRLPGKVGRVEPEILDQTV
jgi:hypothetical protein